MGVRERLILSLITCMNLRHFRVMSWRAKSSSYRENVASARRVNGAGKFGRHVKDARCPLHGGMTFYFSPRSLCESGM